MERKLRGTWGLVGRVTGLDTGWLPIAGISGFCLKSGDGWLNLSLSAATSLTCPLSISLLAGALQFTTCFQRQV